MLAKLLKYEFKSTSRLILILYGVLLFMGVVVGGMLRMTGAWSDLFDVETLGTTARRMLSILTGGLSGVYGILIITVFILTLVTIITRFYRNLLGGEGYLMHTLPVPTWMLVTSKLITAFVWMILTTVVACLSAFLLLLVSGLFGEFLRSVSWEEFTRMLREVFDEIPLATSLFAMVVGTVAGILQFYFAMAIGNLANEHKVLFSVLAFIGINVVVSLIGNIISLRTILNMDRYLESTSSINRLLLQNSLLEAVIAVGFFFGTTLLLQKHLNLS